MGLASHHEVEEEAAETIPMPINTSFVGVHLHSHHGHIQHGHHHHHHHDPSSSSHNQYNNIIPPPLNNSNGGTSSTVTAATNPTITEEDHHYHHHHQDGINDHNSNGTNNYDADDHDEDDGDDMGSKMKKKKMMIRYRECQKNHAASMGGNATDGCGEFMPSGEEGTLESLTCSACSCHRNFHKKEIQGHHRIIRGRKVILGSTPSDLGYPTAPGPPALVPFSRSLTINMPPTYTTLYDQSHDHHGNNNMMMNMIVRPHHDHDHDHHHHHNQVVKKRFRTKFSQEQKEKMLEFAEKVGWKIQKQEESVIQQFCQEVGVKRRVLKVWMHNNKHNFAKKNDNIIIDNNVIINHSS